ncbi:MAG: hypothetical protein M0R73_02575 [Dehalococcoidia bacterium]|nr:hypothetical protein [Dehalococcoidia bacterium]
MAEQSVDVDQADVASTPASPMAAGVSNVTSGALDFFGGTFRLAGAAQDSLTSVLATGAGPAVALLVAGAVLAIVARSKR